MQKLARAIGAACVVALLALPAAGLGASEKGTGGKGRADSKPGQAHDLRSPHQKKQDALRQKALEQVLQGKAKSQKVMRVGDAKGGGQYVELARERTDRIFVLLVEFGNTRHASFCDAGQTCAFPGDGTALTYEGPENNKIPEPDRSVDNSTLWQQDYSQSHYENMYFDRMAEYYESQSSGRYSVGGDVAGLGAGAVQRGALRPRLLRRHHLQQHLVPAA